MAGRPRTRVPLDVFINGRPVGQLARGTSGAIDFRYAPAWLAWENAFPVSLSLPLREDRYIGAPVVAVFDNLLPDDNQIRQRLAARTRAEGTDAFSLLGAIGRDCVGALQFMPEGQAPAPATAIEAQTLTPDEIAAMLRNLGPAPLGVTQDGTFRISLAGAQQKTALLRWRDQWQLPQRSTPTTHILKPPIGRLANGMDLSDSVQNEYLCLKLASAVGLPSASATIQSFGDMRALVVERFDRRWTQHGGLLRLPQEDGCQALSVPPALILSLLKASDDPAEDQRLFLKAQVFFWLLCATDGHAKNFSLRLLPQGRFRLAPLYDIVSTQPLVDAGQMRRNLCKLAMAVGRNRHYVIDEIQPRHFVQTAMGSGVGRAVIDAIFADLATAAPRALDEVASTLPPDFPAQLFDQVASGIHRRLRTILAAA